MGRFVSPITDMKSNGHLLFFKSGTNTALETFKDELEQINNPTNVPVGPNGNLGNVFFSGSAKVVYFDQFNVQYAERDPVGGEKELGDFSPWDSIVVYDKGDFVEGSDGNFYQSVGGGNVGNDPTLVDSAWKEIPFNGIYSAGVSYPIGEVAQTTDGGMWKSLTANNLGNDPTTDDGTNWLPASSKKWIPKSSSFNVNASVNYLVTAATAINATLKASYSIGDPILVKSDPSSVSNITLVNSALSITNNEGTITGGTNITLKPGDVFKGVATGSTTIARFEELPIVNIDNIDFSKLDNPLLHVYAKNDLVRVINEPATSLSSIRNTTATSVDINDVLRTAAVDFPREETTGWLFEGSVPNIFDFPDDFSNAAWARVNEILTPGVTGPDGLASAFRFQNAAAGEASIRQLQSLSGAGADGTVSFWVRATSGTQTFRLQTAGQSPTDETATEEWTRFSLSNTSATGTNQNFGIRTDSSNNPIDVEIAFSRMEELSFPSSVSEASTRAADNQSIPVEGNFRMSEGSIFLKADVIGDTGANQTILDIHDGTTNNRILLIRNPSERISLSITAGGVLQASLFTAFNMDAGTRYAIAVNYQEDNVELLVDGVGIGVDTTVSMPIGLSTVNVGANLNSASQQFGRIADLRFYKENLTIDEIKYLGGQ
ncbi:MAG: hypothetical protein JKY89_10925 [Immundisolibacteraceae bacterium]|nr:hypothetical protein [Immundisolibacteraceae bacterium]